jgi:hypothetical protein
MDREETLNRLREIRRLIEEIRHNTDNPSIGTALKTMDVYAFLCQNILLGEVTAFAPEEVYVPGQFH